MTLSIKGNKAWKVTLTNNSYNFVKLVGASSSSASVSTTTTASGAANTTLNLPVKL